MMTPQQVIAGYIGGFEGLLSLHPADNGNWYDPARFRAGAPQLRGCGTLVGSMRGVTAYALVSYRMLKGMPPDRALRVAQADMLAIDAATALDIGYQLYFVGPGFAKLAWNRVTAAVLDKAWGSGARRAILMLQDMLDLPDHDGKIGPLTVAAFARMLGKLGEEEMAARWADCRLRFDFQLAHNEGPSDPDAAFLNGWNNRTRSFLPGTKWWADFGAVRAA